MSHTSSGSHNSPPYIMQAGIFRLLIPVVITFVVEAPHISGASKGKDREDRDPEIIEYDTKKVLQDIYKHGTYIGGVGAIIEVIFSFIGGYFQFDKMISNTNYYFSPGSLIYVPDNNRPEDMVPVGDISGLNYSEYNRSRLSKETRSEIRSITIDKENK